MDVRPASESDVEWLATLWYHVFTDERSIAQRMQGLRAETGYGGTKVSFVAEQDGRGVGACKIYPMTQHMGGAALPMAGIAAVAVSPSDRRRGIGSELCTRALRIAYDRGAVLSALYPFRPSFYQELGWGYVGTLHVHEMRTAALPAGGPADVRIGTAADERAIQRCYDDWLVQAHGAIERSDAVWRYQFDTPGRHVFVAGTETLRGYAIADYGLGAVPDERTLHVRELIAHDHAAYLDLVAFLSQQRDRWARIRYDAAASERFDLLVDDPRPPTHAAERGLWAQSARVLRGPMLRLVNVRAALERRVRWGAHTAISFTLDVEDDELPENRGPWRVVFDGRRARVEPAAGQPDALHIDCSVERLTQIYAGEITLSEALRLGGAACSGDPAVLDELFGGLPAFRLYDEF